MSRPTFTDIDVRLLQERIAEKRNGKVVKQYTGVSLPNTNNRPQLTRIDIKPLSVNEGYTGKRYKTDAHRTWHRQVLSLLPSLQLPKPPYELYIKFGFTTGASDWDNCIKFFQDCLAKKYKFNDKLIRRAIIETDVAGKGKEFIEWKISSFTSL